MELEYQKKGNELFILLKGELKINSIEKAKELLNQIPNDFFIYNLDFQNVEDIDTSGLQLLIAWKKKLESENKSLHLINHSNKLISLLDFFGLVSFFGGKIRIPKSKTNEFLFKYGRKKGTY